MEELAFRAGSFFVLNFIAIGPYIKSNFMLKFS
jgi:hypothetical protein